MVGPIMIQCALVGRYTVPVVGVMGSNPYGVPCRLSIIPHNVHSMRPLAAALRSMLAGSFALQAI